MLIGVFVSNGGVVGCIFGSAESVWGKKTRLKSSTVLSCYLQGALFNHLGALRLTLPPDYAPCKQRGMILKKYLITII